MQLLYFLNGDIPESWQDQIAFSSSSSSTSAVPPHASTSLLLDWNSRVAKIVMTEKQKVLRRWKLEPLQRTSPSFRRIYSICISLPSTRSRSFYCRVLDDGHPAPDQTPSEQDEWYLLLPAMPKTGDVCSTPKVVAPIPSVFEDTREKLDLLSGVDFRNKKYSQQEVNRRDYGRVYKTINRGVRADILNAESHADRVRMRRETRREKLIEEVENAGAVKDQPMMVTMLEQTEGAAEE